MKHFEFQEFESNFETIIDQVETGSPIVICRNGKPVAQLEKYIPEKHGKNSLKY